MVYIRSFLTFRYAPGTPSHVEQDLRPVLVLGERRSLVGFDVVHVDSDQLGPDSPSNVRVEEAAHGHGVSPQGLHVHQGTPQSLVDLELLLPLPVEPWTRRERCEKAVRGGREGGLRWEAYCGGRGAPLDSGCSSLFFAPDFTLSVVSGSPDQLLVVFALRSSLLHAREC